MKRVKIATPRTGKVAAIYCRKSDAAAGEVRGRSTSQQLEACLMAARSEGFEVPEHLIFIEQDGKKGDWWWDDGARPGPHRPELTKLMRTVEDGLDAVFVWRTDRVYRDVALGATFLDVLREHGTRLFVRNRDLAIHTASGYEAACSESVSNTSYRMKVSEDVTRDHLMLASVGELTNCGSMLGFRSLGKGSKKVRHIPEEIFLIRQIFRWYLYGEEGEGPLSASAIAVRCMERGYRVRVGANGQAVKYPDLVNVQDVLRILRNNHYRGLLPHAGKLYPTHHFDVPSEDGQTMGPVISPDEFEMAQALLQQAKCHRRDKRARLLSGVVVCASCGRPMIVRPSSSGKPAYRCAYGDRRGPLGRCQGVSGRSILAEVLEGWVLEHLAPLLCAELQAIRATRDGDGHQRRLAAAEQELRAATEQEGVKLAQLAAVLDATQIAEVAAQLRMKREALQRTVAELRAAVRRELADQRDPFDLLSHSKSLLREALKRATRWITVTREGVVVLTAASGAYVGARLVQVCDDRGRYLGARILPPTCQATLECRGWIAEEDSFLQGARLERGRWGKAGTRDELLPDFRLAEDYLPHGAEREILTAAHAREEEEARREFLSAFRPKQPRRSPKLNYSPTELAPEEVEAVLTADLLRREGLSYLGIARRLNGQGWRTPSGCEYVATTVQRMVERTHRYASAPPAGRSEEVAA